MKRLVAHIIISITVFLSLQQNANAQVKALPVTATSTLTPPYTAYLSDYSSVGANKLMISTVFNDFSESSVDVYLHIKISSNLVTIETKPNFKPLTRTTLTPGVSKIFKGSDIAPYLNYNNVNLTGITRSELNSTGRLPDGNYQFCVTVKEYNSGRAISRESCTFAFISKQDPPLLTTPAQGTTITPQTPQNITFQWQLKNPPPGGFTNVEYLLKLYEITDPKVDPITAISAAKVLKIYETNTTAPITTTNFNYNVTHSVLEEGKRYTWTITIREKNERQSFKNNGESQIGWFQYGLPAGGDIALKAPDDGHGFSERENKNFKWKAPDNIVAGNKFKFILKIVELGEKTAKEAIEKNTAWYSHTSSEQSGTQDYNHTVTSKTFEKKGEYAWQVTAVSGTRQIASSEIRTISGPPLIKEFYAGNEIVKVISTSTKDLKKLSGVGEVKINGAGDKVKIKFSDLNISQDGGLYTMQSGTIKDKITLDPFELTPRNAVNAKAEFIPDSIKLTKTAFQIHGTFKWPLPHATTGGKKAYVESNETWLTYDKFKLFGGCKLPVTNDYNLLDPGNCRLKLREASDVLISGENQFKLRIHADLWVNSNVNTADNKRLGFYLKDVDQLYYHTIETADEFTSQNKLPLVQKANVWASPKVVVLDLDESQSPGQHKGDKTWKGVYYKEFDMVMQTNLDDSKQQILKEEITQSYNLNNTKKIKLDIDAKGLQCKVDRDFKSSEKSTFNMFPAELKNIQFTVTNSKLKGSVTGTVIIPFISEKTKHPYTIPLNDQGFNAGSFDKTLDGTVVNFNPDGGEQKQIVTIKRAVFANNERLDCTIDLESPVLKHTFKALNSFRIYGDMFIGYGKRNGSQKLSKQVKLKYEGYNINVFELGASLVDGNYAMSLRTTAPLGNDVAGKTGPPVMDFSSIAKVENKPEGTNLSDPKYSSNKPEVPVTIKTNQDKESFTFEKMEVNFNSAILGMKGSLELRKGDPYWGTVFKGDIKGTLKVPSKIEMGASMILGTTPQEMKYWYFDAFFNDTEGMGVSVMGFFNIVAMEGRVYRHMSYDTKSGDFLIDKNIDFGAGLYMQLIDPAGGLKAKADIATEVEVKKSGFTIDVEGDLSLLNSSPRAKGAGGAIKKKAAKQAAKEIAKQIGPIDVTVPFGSDKLKVKAGVDVAGLTYTTGSTSFGFEASLGAAAAASLNYKNGGDEFALSGSKLGSAGVTLKTGGNEVGFKYNGSNSGSLNFNISGFKLASSFDKDKKSGAFDVSYGSTGLKLAADATAGTGSLGLQIDANNSFNAAFDKAGKGSIKVSTSAVNLTAEADKTKQTGALSFAYESTKFAVSADKLKGKGALTVGSGSNKLEASADKAGKGNLLITNGTSFFEVKADKPAGTGSLEIKPDATKRLFVALDKSGSGELAAKYNGLDLAVKADKEAGKGMILAKYNAHRILAKVDKKALEGYFSYASSNDSIMADLSSSKMKVEAAQSGTYFLIDADKKGNGNLKISKGSNAFSIGSNGGTYSVVAKNSTNAVYAKANKSAGTGQLGFKLSSDSIFTSLSSSAVSFYSDISSNKFYITGDKNGKGTLKISTGSKALEIDGDVAKKSGSFSITDGSNALYLAANQSDATGSFKMKAGSDSLKANVKSNEADVAVSFNGVELSVDADRAGKGKIEYSQSGKSIEIDADVVAKSGSFKYADNGFDVSIDSKKEFDLNIGNVNYHLNFGSSYDLKKSGTSVAMGLVNNIGTYTFTQGGYNCTISSTSSIRSLKVEKGGNSVTVSLTSSDAGKLSFVSSGVTYTAEKTTGGSYKLSTGSKSVEIESDKTVTLKDGSTKSVEIASTGLTVKYDAYNMAINASKKEFTYSDGTYGMTFNASEVKLNDAKRSLAIKSDKSFEFKEGTSKNFTLTEDNVKVKYNSYTAEFGTNKSLSFSDGTNSFAASTAGLSLKASGKTIKLNADKSASYEDGTSKFVKINTEGVDLKYDTYTASFSKSKDLNFSDGKNSFALSPTKMELKTGNNSVALENKNGVKSISASDGTNTASFVSSGKASVSYGKNKVTVNGDKMLALKVAKHNMTVDKGEASYTDGDIKIDLGGGNNLLKASKGTRSVSITKSADLALKDGKYSATVAYSNKSLSLSDGTHTVSAGGKDLLAYKQGTKYEVAFYKAKSGQYGLKGTYDGNELAVEAGRSKTVKVIAKNSTIGEISVAANSKKEITAEYKKGSDDLKIETGAKKLNVTGSLTAKVMPGGTGGAKDPELMKKGPSQKGPKYLTSKVSSGPAGIKGKVKMHYDSGKEYLLVSGAVSSSKPFCINGAMVLEQKKDDWSIKVGTRQKRIEVYPTCTGYGGGGFLFMDKKTLEVGVFGGFRQRGCVGIGVADICCSVSMEIFAEAKFTYSPSFKFNYAMVGADFRGSVDIETFLDDWNIASVRLYGKLKADFDNKRISGDLNGTVSILGCSESFSVGFNQGI